MSPLDHVHWASETLYVMNGCQRIAHLRFILSEPDRMERWIDAHADFETLISSEMTERCLKFWKGMQG